MKTKLPLAAVLCLLLFAFAAHAQQQEPTAEQVQRQIEENLRYFQTPRKQIEEQASEFAALSSPWSGQGSWIPLRMFLRTGNEAELGLTDTQKERFSFLYKENELGVEWFRKMHENPTPEFAQAMEAARAAEIPDDRFFERASEEQKNAFREATMMTTRLWLEGMQAEIEETLSPEQMLQVRKLEMQLMPELGIPYPSMFDPLDLTDEQKKDMNKISDEMRGEFDHLLQESVKIKAERLASVSQSLQGKPFSSHGEFWKSFQEEHRQFVPSEAMRKKSMDLHEQGTKLMTLLRTRLMNVLTDEQLDRMQQIMDESPEFVKQVLAEFKKRREAQAKAPGYVPGPDSWRPGDPVPAQFKEEHRTGRFPRSE